MRQIIALVHGLRGSATRRVAQTQPRSAARRLCRGGNRETMSSFNESSPGRAEIGMSELRRRDDRHRKARPSTDSVGVRWTEEVF